MADSLTPWIHGYLVNIAETYGAQLSNVPFYDKKKKVQITEFLTYGSDAQDTYIWARVSDKQYVVPIKFTKEAVAGYSNFSGGLRLTQHKGAIISIKKFRPISSRLPILDGGKPTAGSFLAFECDFLSVLGSSGEGTFGNPKPVTTNPDIQLWADGLTRDGGAGNVLKDRKQEREANNAAAKSFRTQPLMPPPLPVSPRPKVDVTVKEMQLPTKRSKVTDLASYKARWQIVEKNSRFRHPPEETTATDADLDPEVQTSDSPKHRRSVSSTSRPTETLQTNPLPSTRSRSGTPLTAWEASPRVMKDLPSSINDNRPLSAGNTNVNASSIAPPTPAQRIKQPVITPDFPPSSYPPGNESILDIEIANSHSQDAGAVQARRSVPRKVPRPNSPDPEPLQYTGPARVLVPNSDTSGTQSQSQSISQPQSQSQPYLQRNLERMALASQDATVQQPKVDDESMIRDNEEEVSMDIEEKKSDQKPRRRRTSSPRSASTSAHGRRRSSEKYAGKGKHGDGRRFTENADSDSTDGSSISSSKLPPADDEEMDSLPIPRNGREEEVGEYPWMDLRQIRGLIVRASAMRRGLLGNGMIS